MISHSNDFMLGYNSGVKHDPTDPLCQENLQKAKMKYETKAVADYWKGYLHAVEKGTSK
jgi:hypothetical protein